MGAHFGALDDLDAFERAIFDGGDSTVALPPKRWRFLGGGDANADGSGKEAALLRAFVEQECGAKLEKGQPVRGGFIGSVDVNYRRIRTPMIKEDELLPVQASSQ